MAVARGGGGGGGGGGGAGAGAVAGGTNQYELRSSELLSIEKDMILVAACGIKDPVLSLLALLVQKYKY
jgi:hypothetical protein